MADPLSIAAAVVGISAAALHGTRLLLEDLQQLKDAPKTVKRLVEDMHSVDTALKLVQGVEDREWEFLGADVAEQSKMTISCCTEACDLFRTDLQRWTRHSEDGKLAWQDRANVGFFKQAQMKAISEQLSNCKLTINSVVSIATLYGSVRHSHITEEIQLAYNLHVKEDVSLLQCASSFGNGAAIQPQATSLRKRLLNQNGLIRKNKTPKAQYSLLFEEPSYFSFP